MYNIKSHKIFINTILKYLILSSFVVSCGNNVLKDNSKSESLKISLMNVIKKLEQDIQSQAKMIIEAVEYINMSFLRQ